MSADDDYDFSDILEGAEEYDPHKGRQTEPPENWEVYEGTTDKPVYYDGPVAPTFTRPVSESFVATVLGVQQTQIRKRLRKCPVIGRARVRGREVQLFDFVEALSYCIEPKGDIDDWFAQQNHAALPPGTSKAFWDMARQRNRVLLDSNDLWHTEDVKRTLGRVALTIKEEMKLWIENLPGKDRLTDDQYNVLTDMVAALQNTIHEQLINMPNQTQTFAMSHSIRDELNEAGAIASRDRND